MTDKEKIKAEIERRIEELQPCNTRENLRAHGAIAGYYQILSFIDSMQEEPVSKDLEELINNLSKRYPEVSFAKLSRIAVAVAKWQKENLWKPADGDDLPEIDREVVVFTQNFPNDAGIMSVAIGHRPNPYGWDGKSIVTGKVEHYTPKTYDKGGWNIPDVKFWLDVELPKEIEL